MKSTLHGQVRAPDAPSVPLPGAVREPEHHRRPVRSIIGLTRAIGNWPRALVDHLRLSNAPYLCHVRNGGTFEVRGGTDDRHVIFEVFVGGIYPFPVCPGDTVVDIGANIGCFSVWSGLRGARVFSFEPFPANFAILQRNVARNRLQNVRLFQMAVSDQTRTVEMFLPANPAEVGRPSLFPRPGSESLAATSTTLASLIADNRLEKIDILKIDCQGSEYDILFGAPVDALARVRSIMVECEVFAERPAWSVSALGEYLSGLGFEVEIARQTMIYARRAGQ